MKIAAIIPVFEPDDRFVRLVEVLSLSPIDAVIVVNDGSGPEYDQSFELVKGIAKVHFVNHAKNLGKGAALKSGFEYALSAFPDHFGVVTADADGQHDSEDILKVARRLCSGPYALVLGVRNFGHAVPLRSRLGNQLTRVVVSVITGQRITDTQTGLRGIPRSLMPLLVSVPSNGYEFESEMLICCQRSAHPIREEPIRTIYVDGNKSSHFNPVLDSLKIYFTLFRFTISAILSALLDNLVFYLVLRCSFGLGFAQIAGRIASMTLNYSAGRRAVFLSRQPHRRVFPKYLLLVGVSGFTSFALIRILTSKFSINPLSAKLGAESMLFAFNFVVQRKFVFRGDQSSRLARKVDASRGPDTTADTNVLAQRDQRPTLNVQPHC